MKKDSAFTPQKMRQKRLKTFTHHTESVKMACMYVELVPRHGLRQLLLPTTMRVRYLQKKMLAKKRRKTDMAIEILKQKRAELREMARFYNRRHTDGTVGVRAYNLLRKCARLTVAICALSRF